MNVFEEIEESQDASGFAGLSLKKLICEFVNDLRQYQLSVLQFSSDESSTGACDWNWPNGCESFPDEWFQLSFLEDRLNKTKEFPFERSFGILIKETKGVPVSLADWSHIPVVPVIASFPFPLIVIGKDEFNSEESTITIACGEPGLETVLFRDKYRPLLNSIINYYEASQIAFVYSFPSDIRNLIEVYLHGEHCPTISELGIDEAAITNANLEILNQRQPRLRPRAFLSLNHYRAFPNSELFPPALSARYTQVLILLNLEAGLITLAGPVAPSPEQKASINSMLRRSTGKSFYIRHIYSSIDEVERIIQRGDASRVNIEALANEVGSKHIGSSGHQLTNQTKAEVIQLEDLLKKSSGDSEADAKAKDLLSEILLRAFNEGASDIHISTQFDRCWVRYRIDGALCDHPYLFDTSLTRLIIARIKVLSKLDHSYSPLPQDGTFLSEHAGRRWEIRVSVTNTEIGEQAVLRLHDPKRNLPPLDVLGFGQHEAEIVRGAVEADHGLLIICGPTGSGKSTTLYSTLTHLVDRKKWKVITGEQPVEMRIPFIEQIPILPPLTFAKFNESALRQDPDYLLVGETRDPDTALQIIRAANTGHNVFTTLHTNSAAETPARLVDLGVAPYLLADCLFGVVAQRLVRILCSKCKRAKSVTKDWLCSNGVPENLIRGSNSPEKIYINEPVGCDHCRKQGHNGRLAIAEGFTVDEQIRRAIADQKLATELTQLQLEQGGTTLFEQACRLVLQGRVSLSQALALRRR